MKSKRKSRFVNAVLPIVVAGLGFLSSGTAMSANVNFGEIGDTTFADVADFDVTPATITHTNIFGGEDDIRVTGSFFTNSAAGLTGDSIMAMLEPGCVGNVCTSDYVHVSWTTRVGGVFNIADIVLEFGSDPEQLGNFQCGIQGNCIVEDGQLQDITPLLILPANITIAAQSDIPEPATLALAGIALAGLGFSRRKRAA